MEYKDESQHRKWLRHRHWSIMNNNAVAVQFREKLGSYITHWEQIIQCINSDRKLALGQSQDCETCYWIHCFGGACVKHHIVRT